MAELLHKKQSERGVSLYSNTGYLNHSDIEIEDNIHPLIIGSCGIYRMLTVPALRTTRPRAAGIISCYTFSGEPPSFRNAAVPLRLLPARSSFILPASHRITNTPLPAKQKSAGCIFPEKRFRTFCARQVLTGKEFWTEESCRNTTSFFSR